MYNLSELKTNLSEQVFEKYKEKTYAVEGSFSDTTIDRLDIKIEHLKQNIDFDEQTQR